MTGDHPSRSSRESASLTRALGLSRPQALAAFAAMRKVALAGDRGEPSERLLEATAAALGVDAHEATLVDLAIAFPSGASRRALVDALVVPACIEGEVSIERERAVLSIAQELGVRSHWAELLPALRRRRLLVVKAALAKRAPDARRLARRTWQEEGLPGLFRAFAFVLGIHRDEPLAARFRSLASYPDGSFGRTVGDHFVAQGISFPGERNGVPERMVHHDLLHVLTGYDTSPSGECLLAAFYAGFAAGDGFTFIVIALATFHLGLAVSPSVVKPARGAFDPERAIAAFVRGRALRVDVMGAWDYWALMPLPLPEVRATLGITR